MTGAIPAPIVVTLRVRREPVLTKFASATLLTAAKLDWITCLAFDERLYPYDKIVGIVIAQHVYWKTGQWKLADETIAYELSGSTRNVRRARERLRRCGWLAWRNTLDANDYRLDFGNVNGILDTLRKARETRRKRGAQLVGAATGGRLEKDVRGRLTPRGTHKSRGWARK